LAAVLGNFVTPLPPVINNNNVYQIRCEFLWQLCRFFYRFFPVLSSPFLTQVPRAASTKSTLLSSAGVTFWKCYFTFCFVFLPFTVRIILSFSQGSCQRRLLFTISMICGCAPSFEECQCTRDSKLYIKTDQAVGSD